MASHVATAQNATLQGESTAQQRTLPATLARRLVTGKQKCRKSNKAKDAHKKPKSQPQWGHGGRKRADEVGISEGDPAFDEIMIQVGNA